jgi:hypothetical protein
LAPNSVKFIQYKIPDSELTTETLDPVDSRDYQISMSPTGDSVTDPNGDYRITWSASSAEDPSFDATNATNVINGERSLFISGILWGIVGGAAVAGADHFYDAYKERVERRHRRRIPL